MAEERYNLEGISRKDPLALRGLAERRRNPCPPQDGPNLLPEQVGDELPGIREDPDHHDLASAHQTL